jgi:hypothetical protein
VIGLRSGVRTARLDSYFCQTQEDAGLIATSTEKVTRRAARIDAMEFGRDDEPGRVVSQPDLRLAKGE